VICFVAKQPLLGFGSFANFQKLDENIFHRGLQILGSLWISKIVEWILRYLFEQFISASWKTLAKI